MQLEFPEGSSWLIGKISEKLMSRSFFLGTAESCTGGLASALCTAVPGSSRWFAGGIVSYSNRIKQSLLGVEAGLLETYGAVSAQVVEGMARGAIRSLGVDVSLAVSGVAGPGGGTAEKPVGTVWIATAVRNKEKILVASFCRQFPGDRTEVRFGAAMTGFGAVNAALEKIGV